MNTTNIIQLSNIEAKEFLLTGECYCNFLLPTYFVFNKLLKEIADKIDDSSIKDLCKKPKDYPSNLD